MFKSESKKKMEKSMLEAVMWMGIESLEPIRFEQLDDIINILHETRHLGEPNLDRVKSLKCALSDMADKYQRVQIEIGELKLLHVSEAENEQG